MPLKFVPAPVAAATASGAGRGTCEALTCAGLWLPGMARSTTAASGSRFGLNSDGSNPARAAIASTDASTIATAATSASR
jgi:hypothetical protein